MRSRIQSVRFLRPPAWRLSVILPALTLLIALTGCDRQPDEKSLDVNPHNIAERLIKRTIADEDSGHVAVEIDHELLAQLTAGAMQEASTDAFRDPLLAAWLFAPYIGVPTHAMLSVERVSPEVEVASGLYIAVVDVAFGEHSTKMRLVSEPGSDGQPTLWVLNDYDG